MQSANRKKTVQLQQRRATAVYNAMYINIHVFWAIRYCILAVYVYAYYYINRRTNEPILCTKSVCVRNNDDCLLKKKQRKVAVINGLHIIIILYSIQSITAVTYVSRHYTHYTLYYAITCVICISCWWRRYYNHIFFFS